MSPTRSRLRFIVPVLAFSLVAAACSSSAASKSGGGSGGGSGGATAASGTEKVTLRLGYFGNVTHAPAMIGLQDGELAKALGADVTLKPSVFNAGPNAVEALFSKSIDASFVGPNPAINAYSKSKGAAIRIVAGTASGGAFLVVKPEIKTAADLKGKSVGSPSLGNTQDVALRYWLKQKGLSTDTNGGGDVKIVPGPDNGTVVQSFQQGDLAGAWMPEPYATKMVKAGGHILVNEADLWPGGRYVTTLLVVRTEFLHAHPGVVKNLIAGLSDSIAVITADPAKAADLVSKGIEAATGKSITTALVTSSFKSISFTLDPVASSLRTDVDHAVSLGILDKTDLTNIFDLSLLNQLLTSEGKPTVAQ
ncbi:MAG TPA: ABC transporter substrate-binding protein [Acidimicrobiia bacterium]